MTLRSRTAARPWGVLLGLALLAGLGSVAASAQVAGAEDETIERILELRRQIDALIATLPPEARERLARRLAEGAEADASGTGAAESEKAETGTAGTDTAESEAAETAVDRPVSTAAGPPLAETAEPEDTAPEPRAPARRRLARRPSCNFLDVLDENQDGRITALDRYWRYLYVWSDKNGDREAQDGEVESVYASDIREIATDLATFVRKKGNLGEIRVDGYAYLDVRADGFGSPDDGVLVVDATRLKRGTGPELRSAGGEPLEGFQPFEAGLQVRDDGGRITELACP